MSEDVPMEPPAAEEIAAPAPAAEAESSTAPAAPTTEDDKPIAPLGTSKKAKTKSGPTANGSGASKKKGGKAEGSGEKKEFQLGDVVLTKMKGYPSWPSRLVDPSKAPAKVALEKPKGSSYFLSQYFPDGSYSWSKGHDLLPLPAHEIEAYLSSGSKKVNGDLFKAYQVAQDPSGWISDREALEASAAEAGEDEDELGDPEEEVEEKGGKRKRASGEGKKEATKAKKAKLENLVKKKGAKSKATVDDDDDEEPSAEPATKKKAPAAPKSKKAKATSEPEAAPPAEEGESADPMASDPEAVKVKEWRHKLQRAFLSKTLPGADEMPTYHELFETIEKYEKMSIDYLQHSKIGKVMKKIAGLKEIPRNDEFNITKRALDLMNLWHDKVSASTAAEEKTAPDNDAPPAPNGDAAPVDDSAAATAVNGDSKPVEGQEAVPMETS